MGRDSTGSITVNGEVLGFDLAVPFVEQLKDISIVSRIMKLLEQTVNMAYAVLKDCPLFGSQLGNPHFLCGGVSCNSEHGR